MSRAFEPFVSNILQHPSFENQFLGTQRDTRADCALELKTNHLRQREVKWSRGLRCLDSKSIALSNWASCGGGKKSYQILGQKTPA